MARMGSVPVYIGGNTESPADGFISISPASNELTNLQEGQSILDDWIYVDRDTAITGSTQCTNPSSNSTFNMQLKAGWNFRLIKLVKMVNGQLTQVELYAAQTLPSNYKLKYSPRTTATK